MAKKEPETEAGASDGKQGPQTDAPATEIFVAYSVFPDPAAIFTAKPRTLEQSKDTASIVLDTNPLLVPFGAGAQTLQQVEATYRKLLGEGRLFIPAQVAREFARNRATKLAELYQKLLRIRSGLQRFQQGNYPLLETLPEYVQLRELEKQLDELSGKYKQSLGAVIDLVASWEWNDPVSLLYGRLFSPEIIIDSAKPLEEIRQEHVRRFRNKIPPGYKDSAKEDEGVGDLLIWLAILDFGKSHQKSVIFVSGEEKADWWYRSEGQQLYPRYELTDEFRRASEGQSFHIIKFSRLLELFGASNQVVAEVREKEAVAIPQGAPAKDLQAGTDLQITKALYGVDGHWQDVTAALRVKVRDGRIRVAATNEELGGDPAPNIRKSLRVVFSLNGEPHSQTLAEDEILSLP